MDGWQKAWDMAGTLCEVAMLLALATLGMVLLPLFCLQQAIKGDPLWFWPKYSKTQPAKPRGGYWDHPEGPWNNDHA